MKGTDMKAFGVTRFGAPLTVFDASEPDLLPDQVLVRVAAAGIGMWDVAMGAGAFGGTFPLPLILGWEGTGTVEAVGAGVTRFAVGDAVIGYDRSTGWLTERVGVPQTSLAHAPRGLDLVDAASLPIAGSTAIQTLNDVLHVGPGETVLIAGAAGPTGYLTAQYARHLGAEVIATAGPANLDFVRALGVEVVLNHEDGVNSLVTAVRQAKPNGVDVLVDCVSGENYRGLLPAVRAGGRGASITPPLADRLPDSVTSHAVQSSGDQDTLGNVVQLVNDGILTGSVRKVFNLDDAQAAFDLLQTGHGRGKIIVRTGVSMTTAD